MGELLAYLTLFVIALGAATLLPLQSEALLVGLQLAGYPAVPLLLVASVGNVLGSTVNWYIGRAIERFRGRRWFPATDAQLERAQRSYRRHGRWSLLLSWAPVIGDPITLVAGVMREPLPRFLLLVGIAKFGRYAVLAFTVRASS